MGFLEDKVGARRPGLNKLSFFDNFESAFLEMEIPAGTEKSFANPFRDGRVPRYFITLDISGGMIIRGTSPWTKDLLYFSNPFGTTDAKATILLLR